MKSGMLKIEPKKHVVARSRWSSRASARSVSLVHLHRTQVQVSRPERSNPLIPEDCFAATRLAMTCYTLDFRRSLSVTALYQSLTRLSKGVNYVVLN
jgi:hypothetical protein